MKDRGPEHGFSRRGFIRILAAGGALAAISPKKLSARMPDDEKPATNGRDALKYPRTPDSMPGKFPGKVSQAFHEQVIREGIIDSRAVHAMLAAVMTDLTGKKDLKEAWRLFFDPADRIGIKVNPVAGASLSTRPELVRAIIDQLSEAGIPKANLLIWDRREFELEDAGFSREAFPDVKLKGTECKDEKGSFTDAEGRLYSLDRIDEHWFYFADVEENYDAETLPYMINSGKHSYFTKICTTEVDKIINVPVLKNAGYSVTLCLKNLAYGAVSNTSRLHKKLWGETSAEVCAFPPLRDKVVLNIVDGIRGCYNGGPAANEQYIEEYKTLMAGTDPVAVDRVGYEFIVKRRIELKVQEQENPKGRRFLDLASGMNLGIADLEKIIHHKIQLS